MCRLAAQASSSKSTPIKGTMVSILKRCTWVQRVGFDAAASLGLPARQLFGKQHVCQL